MSSQTIVTRIEGHLRIEAEFDGQVITKASSSGTMVRGIEIILQGRDPRDAWAFAQRICGVCTVVHGLASVRAVEDALKYAIPANAQLIRNLMIATQFVHDHVMHFYHLHALDWVDVVSALKADPKATSALAQSISSYSRSSPGYFADVQTRVKKLVESGQLGIFANAYWGHPGYALPPEANLMAVAHYLDALAWQREVVQLQTIFGGKNPYRGETRLNYSAPQPPFQNLDTSASYSWVKSPRWKGHAKEVGPLARVLMLYASGHEPTKELAHKALTQLNLPLEALFSTMGRTAARALECKNLRGRHANRC